MIFKQFVFVKYDTYVLSTYSFGINIKVQLAQRKTCISLAIESSLLVRYTLEIYFNFIVVSWIVSVRE